MALLGKTLILWMDEILHHFETMVETLVCWYLQGNRIIPAFLRWCEMDFVHPSTVCVDASVSRAPAESDAIRGHGRS